MNLKQVTELDFEDKTVFIRLDLDLPLNQNGAIADDRRVLLALPTVKYVLANGPRRIVLAGHIGRIENGEIKSTQQFEEYFSQVLAQKVSYTLLKDYFSHTSESVAHNIIVLENLRAYEGEETNDETFARGLSEDIDVYINEAFAVSHRENASVAELPQLITKKGGQVAAGMRFVQEVENLGRVLVNPKRPVLVLLSGAKEDKLDYLTSFATIADKTIVGGRLPLLVPTNQTNPEKIIVAQLSEDGKDIARNFLDTYSKYINDAGTIVVSGPMGLFDDGVHSEGTRHILTAIAQAHAFKLAGGGDTEAAIALYQLTDQFDWISVGGGAMLDYLVKGTLPGIEALLH